ncbi:hypothetical protein MNBD_GAMMA12-1394 [hydrothermal vent metagenome]|uniref:histidine kinase n=1 Tax=hydrothermal vent metagenome TaxID=652676 RepID=A0A3B0Z5P3_9ZZZZ
MSTSAKKHIYFQFLKLSLLIVVPFIVLVHQIFESIEDNMLKTEVQKESEHYKSIVHAEPRTWTTASAISAFVPKHIKNYPKLPSIFKNIPIPFSGEVKIKGVQYWIIIHVLKSGDLYIAKDISSFESMEKMVNQWLIVLGIVFILLGFVIAWLSSKRIFTPLNELAEEISAINPERYHSRVSANQRDWELKLIATQFNTYLDAMESYINREKALVSMASHELRTPVAIISGALDVLDGRDTLSAKDKKTINRIRVAVKEMDENVVAILTIARNGKQQQSSETIIISHLFKSIRQDLIEEQVTYLNRVEIIESQVDHKIFCVKALVKILIKNLIQNSLQHTSETVVLQQTEEGFIISDEGCGLPDHALKQLTSGKGCSIDQGAGLGLFIVTLISEQLNWRISIDEQCHGTLILVSLK